ncbi:MAG TPA: M23 family metallopeptidase [Candidatus Kapabacteria bacterium]|nr:M23 family metallopeptidase [Candidatus Kapabacteria bacterium]
MQFNHRRFAIVAQLLVVVSTACALNAAPFVLPTPNRAIFTPGAEADYFVPTPGRTWTSGTFGCVRSEGFQMHEGLDIKHTKLDLRREAMDPIYAAAEGRVAYINSNAGLSNYGKYIVLEHRIDGIPVYTTYAHLSAFASGLSTGDAVRKGQTIATMGRTTNTRSPITKDRAHLHFEITVRLNDRYSTWHNATLKGQRNDHGNWNGRNFIGVDPRQVFLAQEKLGAKFSFLEFVRNRTELCRVLVRDTRFSWLRNYTPLVRRNPVADREGVAAYEISFDYNGLPFLLVPRAKSEIDAGTAKVKLLSVNEKEQSSKPCRKLVTKRGGDWQLGNTGSQLVDLLLY